MSDSVQVKGVAVRISAPKGGVAPTITAKGLLHKQTRSWVGVVVDRIPKVDPFTGQERELLIFILSFS